MVRNPLRLNKSNHTGVKKGPWSAEEDRKLVAYIRRYGIWNWNHMPKPAGLARTGKSCRLRWMNYLRPHIRHGNITKEEEDMVVKLHQLLGNIWAIMAARLPGRTDNEIKNYWNTYLKKLVENENKSQISTSCDIKVMPSLPTIDTPREESDMGSQSVIPTMSADCFCSSYGVHYHYKTSTKGWYSPSDMIAGEESLWEQFLALKEFQNVENFGCMYMQSEAKGPLLACIEQDLVYHGGSYEDFMMDSWE